MPTSKKTHKNPEKAQEIKDTNKALLQEGIVEHRGGTNYMTQTGPYHDIARKLVTAKELGQLAQINEDDGPNTKQLKVMIGIVQIAQNADIRDVDGMRQRFYAYLTLCAKYDVKIGNMAAYAAMGINHNLASSWEKGNGGLEKQELIREVKSMCGSFRELAAMEGTMSPNLAMFYAKNYDGLSETSRVEMVADDGLGDRRTAQEIAQQYGDLAED